MNVGRRIRPFVLFIISLISLFFTTHASVTFGAAYSEKTSNKEELPFGRLNADSASVQRIEKHDVAVHSSLFTTNEAKNVKYISHIGGSIIAVAVKEEYAYVGEGPTLAVLDISNPAEPVLAGKISPLPYYIVDIAIAGDYAFVAADKDGLRIFDISDPVKPIEVGFYKYDSVDDSGATVAVAVAGSYAYLANQIGGLLIIDITNPARPKKIGVYSGGEILDVVVKGKYAYTAAREDWDFGYSWYALRIINISDPTKPSLTGSFETKGDINGIAVAGRYAYVTDSKGLRLLNISNPTRPIEAGLFKRQYLGEVDAAGNYVYVTGGGDKLRIIDVSNPSEPNVAGTEKLPDGGSDLTVVDNFAFVALGIDGLQIVDVSNPESPAKASIYDPPGHGLARRLDKAGNQLFVVTYGGKLRIHDVSDPSTPVEIGSFQTREEARAVAVDGDFAYVACNRDLYDASFGALLQVVSVADPVNPVGIGLYESFWGYPYSIVVSGNYVYGAAGNRGFVIYDVTDPSKPLEIGGEGTPGSAREVAVSGEFAYVADGSHGLRIFDVSKPANPKEVGSYKRPDHSEDTSDVAVVGKCAYVANGYYGLHIVNVSNPAKPKQIGVFNPSDVNIEQVAIAGNFAFVIDDRDLIVVDVFDPANPLEVGYYRTPGFGSDLVVDGDIIYISEEDVLILQFTDPTVPPQADFSASPTSGLPPLQVEFTNLSTGVYDECIWDFGNGRIKNSCDRPATKYRFEGNYTVSLTVKGPGGEDAKIIENYIKVGDYLIFLPGVLKPK